VWKEIAAAMTAQSGIMRLAGDVKAKWIRYKSETKRKVSKALRLNIFCFSYYLGLGLDNCNIVLTV
jgi:hypothetical protein